MPASTKRTTNDALYPKVGCTVSSPRRRKTNKRSTEFTQNQAKRSAMSEQERDPAKPPKVDNNTEGTRVAKPQGPPNQSGAINKVTSSPSSSGLSNKLSKPSN